MRRLATVLLTTSLALAGTALVPAQAADLPEPRPAPPEAFAEPAAELPTRAIIVDPADDARSFGNRPGPKGLADLRRVSVRTPTTADGTMTVRVTWARLQNAARGGVLRQQLGVSLNGPRGQFYGLDTTNRRGAVTLTEFRSDRSVRIRPEILEVDHDFGVGGTTTITLSTEWYEPGRVSVNALSIVGLRRATAYDFTGSRTLRVGRRG